MCDCGSIDDRSMNGVAQDELLKLRRENELKKSNRIRVPARHKNCVIADVSSIWQANHRPRSAALIKSHIRVQ